MKKVIALLSSALFSCCAFSQTYTVNNLAINGNTTATGGVTNPIIVQGSPTKYLSKPGVTGQQIYTGICAGCTSYDNVQSTMTVPSGSTVTTMAGYGSYINNQTAGGSDGNTVNYFSVSTCSGTNSNCWGANPVLQDSTTYAISSVSGVKLIGTEYDMDVMSPNTTVQGISFLGSSLSQPAFASAINVGNLSVQSPGLAKWTYAFTTADGAVTNAIQIGAAASSGSNITSQPVFFSYFNGSAVQHQMKLQAFNDALNITSNGQPDGLYLATGSGNTILGTTGTNSNINLRLAASGSGSIIANSPIITNGYTVGTLPSGQIGARAHVTDATACTFMSGITGGGSIVCPVFFNGSAWVAE
jgi:hypothetical protein